MPKIALISDVHANIEALTRVVEKLDNESPDLWICLGDLVGYGPSPNEVIDLIRQRDFICVLGNHDAGVTGKVPLKHFRNPNRTLIEKTKQLIKKEHLSWLESLSLTVKNDNWMAVHASPFEPEKWRYLNSAVTARDILSKIDVDLCFVGHTHKPVFVSNKLGVNTYKKGFKYLINPGSVGQSRDEDYRASCCIVDTEKFIYKNFRVDYPVNPVMSGLMKMGFTKNESRQMLRIN